MRFAWAGLEYYGKQNGYVTEAELDQFAALTAAVHNDNYSSTCDE